MENNDNYKQQAQYWNNYRLIDRTVKACVHLEDKDDTIFWDSLFQKYRPGNYHYISYSYSNKNKKTTGCEQCLRFAPYLTDYFFVCIDSDYRYLLGQANLDVKHHILQTYAYSWENHYCQASNLQNRVNSVTTINFDFSNFINRYSKVVYKPLLVLLNSRKNNDGELRDKEFNQCLISQCTAKDMERDCDGAIEKIKTNLNRLLESHKSYVDSLDFDSLKSHYEDLGLVESTAYLHVRGHNIFDLVSYIGKFLYQRNKVDFSKTILTSNLPANDYWEMNKLVEDIKAI